jgi:hypothetical protein
MAGWSVERMRIFLWQNIFGGPSRSLFGLPGFNWVLWRGCNWFNRNRFRVSRFCRLPEKGLTVAKEKF